MFVSSLRTLVFKQRLRKRIGPSSIGEGCERKLWKKLYEKTGEGYASYDYRQHDIFERGKWEEARICTHLERCGHVVERRNVKVSSPNPAFHGEMDGIVCHLETGERYVLEIKTMKQEHFNVLEKKGCQKAKFLYWCQCQCYMGMSGLPQTLFVVRNKNTEWLYQEIIPFDEGLYTLLLQKFERIKGFDTAPPGYTVLKKPHFECAWCPYKSDCWKEENHETET
jgi:hypothetical protein